MFLFVGDTVICSYLQDIYAILLATDKHTEWLSHEVQSRPANGSMILYDRGKHGYNYRRDGYMWKKRKDGRHPREDHMKLRIKGSGVGICNL